MKLNHKKALNFPAAIWVAMGVAMFWGPSSSFAANETVNVWLTNPSSNTYLAQQANIAFSPDSGNSYTPLTISVDESRKYQQIVGFGAALSDSSAYVINRYLSSSAKTALFNNLFSTTQGIGLSFMRLPMGATDLSASGNYSYDDRPAGQTDPNLANFSIAHDTSYIIPELQQMLGINPNIKIVATPWSPPAWMKTSGSMIGGSLIPSYYQAYANYFTKFIQSYRNYGIPIQYLAVQNEALFSPSGYPGMIFPATSSDPTTTASEAYFIGNYLGPTLAANNINTQILGYDHNWDQPNYPQALYADSSASPYISGTAWHCYGGVVSAQTDLHNQYPNKDQFITECSGGTWQANNTEIMHGELDTLIINGLRNWARGVNFWNLALDTNNGPTNGGCTTCRGVVTVNQNTGAVTYNLDYYILGQASKFVKQGAYRIGSNSFGNGSIENVALQNPDGSKVLIAYNSSGASLTFKVMWGAESFSYTLPANAGVTFTWPGTPSSGLVLGAVDLPQAVPGDTVQLAGSGFGASQGTSKVYFGSVAAAVTDWSNGLITVLVPSGITGTVNVTVNVNDQTSNSAPFAVEHTLPRTSWVASASSSSSTDVPANALDGNINTRWSSGAAQKNGQSFIVNMGSAQAVNEISMDSGPSTGDYARSYTIYVSQNGKSWTNVASGSAISSPEIVTFPTQNSQYIKVMQTGNSGDWWSIAEFNAYSY
jgi:O-glycosyl hydrolase